MFPIGVQEYDCSCRGRLHSRLETLQIILRLLVADDQSARQCSLLGCFVGTCVINDDYPVHEQRCFFYHLGNSGRLVASWNDGFPAK